MGQVIVAADLANFSEGLTQLASFILLAQNHYPERLAFAVLSRPPTLFWLAWSAAQVRVWCLDKICLFLARNIHSYFLRSHEECSIQADYDVSSKRQPAVSRRLTGRAWCMQAFLDEKTRAKISLVYTNEELRTALLPHIQPAHLYESLGGCVSLSIAWLFHI